MSHEDHFEECDGYMSRLVPHFYKQTRESNALPRITSFKKADSTLTFPLVQPSHLVHDLVPLAVVAEFLARAAVLAPGVGMVEGGRLVRLRRVTAAADGAIPHAVVDLRQYI